jgi:hypothetical protein
VCFNFLYNFRLKYSLFYEEISEILPQMYTGLPVKCPLFLSDFNQTSNFSRYFGKMIKFQISKELVQWVSCSVRTDGQTDRQDKANGRFSHFFKSA